MNIPVWLRWSALGALAAAIFASVMHLNAAPNDYTIAQKPLYLASSETPLMMMVMSRDERLFIKAYSDYTDLNEDGQIDTTYQDSFDYSGYFDPFLCYEHNNSRFKAIGAAEGENMHECPASNQWSGNFLNWVTMSRLDILRHVLYGGRRSTDSLTTTVLERAHIPNDLHAWVKTYAEPDIARFTPYSNERSFCNASFSLDGAPKMRIAEGIHSEWAATSLSQCNWRSNDGDSPASGLELDVRVEVCDPGSAYQEEFCQRYTSSSEVHYKPVGLLQRYGENGRLRFGLMSGSYSRPRSGGVLRQNIGRFAGNGGGCAGGDEVDLSTGQFCDISSGEPGIVRTVDHFKLTQWNGNNWVDCPQPGILNRGTGDLALRNPGQGNRNCSAWGNPISEIYAEALRYIAGESEATPEFVGSDDLAGLPVADWLDPYRPHSAGGNSFCANCNILVLSSSLPSFDSDEVPGNPVSDIGDGFAATDEVGANEGLSGRYVFGSSRLTPPNVDLDTHADYCSEKDINGLSLVRGICPDIPSMEGSYIVSGLAYKARTTDLRSAHPISGRPSGWQNTATTYAVALADNLPKFDIPVGGGTISISPLCQAHSNGSATPSTAGWRSCFLGSVSIGPKLATASHGNTFGRELEESAAAGSFSLVWEDSLWGNDHDNDVVSMLTYCVGSACDDDTNPAYSGGKDICWLSTSPVCNGGSPSVASNEVLVRIENLSMYAGHSMLTGFSVSGSDNDGTYREVHMQGNIFDSALTGTALDSNDEYINGWGRPYVMRLRIGQGEARNLESPLWYAAKHGGFRDLNGNGRPDPGEWDSREPGQPDNYFFARDPSQLKDELERIFETAANQGATSAGGGAGARIGDASFTIEAGFEVPDESTDWIGYLRAFEVTSTGAQGVRFWDVADHMPSPDSRRIYTVTRPTVIDASGAVDDPVVAREFTAANLGSTPADQLAALGVPSSAPDWLGTTPSASDIVSYIRGSSVSGFRDRSSILGSIINSQPQVVTPRDDFGYGDWTYAFPSDPDWKTALGGGYQAYLESKESRAPMVYVGANDGMLHAFNASRLTSNGGGDEVFAFIPAGARNHLYELANPGYDHRYFVDGELTVSDASFSSTGEGTWRTVLVGSTGGGGAAIPSGGSEQGHGSVFALDVSNPGGFNDNHVLWELSGENDEYLGFVLGKPMIVPVAGADGAPRWVAMFGNGPNSANGRPVLFVVDIETGEVISRIMPAASSYASRNGLMNIAGVAVHNHHGLVDAVYGGDLQGNLWKFDLRNWGDWDIAHSGPLFRAGIDGDIQPITGGIEVSSGPGGGVSIFFGTGSYFAEGDRDTNTVQSLYGIWDNLSDAISGRAQLVGQQLTAGGVTHGHQYREVDASPINFVANRGWYVDLLVDENALGERYIGVPRLQSGRVIFVAYEPGVAGVCSAGGGVNWEYVLNMMSGAGGMSGISLSPGGDAVCEGADCAGIALTDGSGGPSDGPSAPVRSTSIYIPPLAPGCDPSDPTCTIDELIDAERCTFVLRAPGASPQFMPRPCGRQSWRQLR